MATVNKNFRVKDGLVVEGAKGTINGSDILTAAAIENGAAENQNITVTYDSNANKVVFIAENGVADSTTDNLTEGQNNLYFTDQRAIDAVGGSATSANTPNTVVKRDGNGDFAAGTITAGSLSTSLVSVGDAGTISDEGVLAIDSATGNSTSITGDTAVNITSNNGYVGLNVSTGAYVNEDEIVTRTASQVLTNKTINDELHFTNPSTQAYDGGIVVNDTSEDFEIKAYTANLHLSANNDVTIQTNNGNILLSPDSQAYYGGTSAEHEIATHGYVDSAVSGLSWKEAVNLLWNDPNAGLAGTTGTLGIDGHANLTSSNNGYRILITTGTNRGIWSYADDGANWTLTRSADADTINELIGAAVYVMEGTTYGATSWVQGNHYAANFVDQVWTQFSGTGSVTAGSGITVNGLQISIDRTTTDTWYDLEGSAQTAENNAKAYADTVAGNAEQGAKDYADSLAVNYDASGAAATAETNANNYTDNAIINGNSSATPTYQAINIGYYSKEVGSWAQLSDNTPVTLYSMPYPYRSGKFVVRVMNNTSGHSQMSEILVTADSLNNVAITEYGIVGTNGNLADITANFNVAATSIEIKVTALGAGSEAMLSGTTFVWND